MTELKIRLQELVNRLNLLLKRVTEKTELGVFLIDVCQVCKERSHNLILICTFRILSLI